MYTSSFNSQSLAKKYCHKGSYSSGVMQQTFGILPMEFSIIDSQASTSNSSTDSMDSADIDELHQQSTELLSTSDSLDTSDQLNDPTAASDIVTDEPEGEPAAPLSVSLLRQLGICPGLMQCMKAELLDCDSCCDTIASSASPELSGQGRNSGRASVGLRPLTVVRPRVTCLRYGRPLRRLTFG